MDFTCQDALPLVPGYLDGELSEVRAGLLRKHLLDCSACRTHAQDEKALARWFVAAAKLEVAPPFGFAARVARRAFAGDAGERETVAASLEPERGRLLQFVLTLTAAAAAVMLVSAIALRKQPLPGADRLEAANPPASTSEVLLKLDELNRVEKKQSRAMQVITDATPAKKP